MSDVRRVPPHLFDYDALARYNSERARGIMHDQEWVQRMALIQSNFDREMTARATAAYLEARKPARRRWFR